MIHNQTERKNMYEKNYYKRNRCLSLSKKKKVVSSLCTYHVIGINNQNNKPCKLKYTYYYILHILHIIHVGILKTNRITVPNTMFCLFVYKTYLCLIDATSFT